MKRTQTNPQSWPQKHTKQNTAYNWFAYLNRSTSLRLLLEQRILVDTILSTIDGYSTTIHGQVFDCLSPKLRGKCSTTEIRNNSTRNLKIETKLPGDIDSVMAKLLIGCAYGDDNQVKMLLNNQNLHQFYQIGRTYEIETVVNICLNYARCNSLNLNNCIRLYLLSFRHRHHKLRRACYNLLKLNFKLILHTNEDFHLIPFEPFKSLLLDDFLKLDDYEEFSWLAILRWCQRKPISPLEYMNIYNEMIKPSDQIFPNNVSQRPEQSDWLELQVARLRLFTSPRDVNNQSNRLLSTTININFYNSIIPFDDSSTSVPRESKQDDFTLGSDLFDTGPLRRTEMQLYELIKCLRFIRLKSPNAFRVIASNRLVQHNAKIQLLLGCMKLKYIAHHKLPFNEINEFISLKEFEKFRLNELPTTQRFIKKASKLFKFNLIRHQLNPSPLDNAEADADEDILKKARTNCKKVKEELYANSSNCIERALKPRVPNSIALLFGGYQNGSVCKSVMAYDFVYDKWFKLNVRLPEPRAFHATCSIPETRHIYIFGGTDGELILNSVLKFDPENVMDRSMKRRCLDKNFKSKKLLSYRFHKFPPMKEKRCHLSGLYHLYDKRIYALGGHNGRERLKSGERFDFKSKQWHEIAEMSLARLDASACSHNNKIFIAGGQIGEQFIQSSVEFYKSSDNTWTFLTPMIVPRMSFQLVSYRNFLLAIGGTNGLMGGNEIGSVTRSVERYNPTIASWTLCSTMAQKRCSFGVMSIENNLIVVGGFNGRRKLKTCESLKIGHYKVEEDAQNQLSNQQRFSTNAFKTNSAMKQPEPTGSSRPPPNMDQSLSRFRTAMKWIPRASLPSKRSGFSISVVKNLKNAKDFTYHGSIINKNLNRVNIRPSVVKQKGKWDRLKIIKKRKLIKHAKIALVVIVVILMI